MQKKKKKKCKIILCLLYCFVCFCFPFNISEIYFRLRWWLKRDKTIQPTTFELELRNEP